MIKTIFAGLLSIFSSNTSTAVLTESEFAELFIAEAQRQYPFLNVKYQNDFEIIFLDDQDSEIKTFLDNAYNNYLADVEQIDDVLSQ